MSGNGTRPTSIQGRVWVLRDAQGAIIDDIDTDMIFHNAHLAVTDVAQMGQYALGNLAGHEDFPTRVQPGDMLLVGRNFGAGSSRQQAVDCFVSLGCSLLIAESFGAIYKRNAINAGFPIMLARGLTELVDGAGQPLVCSGDELQIDLERGEVVHLASGRRHASHPISGVQLDIYRAGSLFAHGLERP